MFTVTFKYHPTYNNQYSWMGCTITEETLTQYWDYLCGEHKNNNTKKNRHWTIRHLLKYTDGEINKQTIQQWKTHLNKKYKRNTINVYIQRTNQFLTWLGHDNLRLPLVGYEETDHHVLTEHEILKLMHYGTKDNETHLILQLLWNLIRPQAIINIKTTNRYNDILYLKDTKTGNNHTILNNTLQQAWENYLQNRPKPLTQYKDYLLICNNNKWLGKPYATTLPIYSKIRKLGKTTLNQNISPYTIKRTSITLRLDKTSQYFAGDIKIVQRLARHKNPNTTLKYDQRTDEDLRKYLNSLEKHYPVSEKHLSQSTQHYFDKYTDGSPQNLNKKKFEYDDNDNSCYSYSIITFFISICKGVAE